MAINVKLHAFKMATSENGLFAGGTAFQIKSLINILRLREKNEYPASIRTKRSRFFYDVYELFLLAARASSSCASIKNKYRNKLPVSSDSRIYLSTTGPDFENLSAAEQPTVDCVEIKLSFKRNDSNKHILLNFPSLNFCGSFYGGKLTELPAEGGGGTQSIVERSKGTPKKKRSRNAWSTSQTLGPGGAPKYHFLSLIYYVRCTCMCIFLCKIL